MNIFQIDGIDIDNFRKFENQSFDLGSLVTVVFGRNGTLKSTLMGLIAQPFRTTQKDIFERNMQTQFSDIFKLSLEKDADKSLYNLKLNVEDNLKISEPVPVYKEKDPGTSDFVRFRLVPSGREAGDGFFNLPSVYTKLDRVYPLIDSPQPSKIEIQYTDDEIRFVQNFFEKVLLREDFKLFDSFETTAGEKDKHPFAPANSYYDIDTISSGEDNLSAFINTMISFMRLPPKIIDEKEYLRGVWDIDEFEASLHPVAQDNLFNYLYGWSKKYKVQIVINTHSLSLLENVMHHTSQLQNSTIVVNLISSKFMPNNKLEIIKNPTYEQVRNELTLGVAREKSAHIKNKDKIKILCEDKIAEGFIKRILPRTGFSDLVQFESDSSPEQVGTTFLLLEQLCKNFPNILNETNSIVIFDADQPNIGKKIRSFKNFKTIPSYFKLPLEKELVLYVLKEEGDSQFFKSIGLSQDEFKQLFTEFQLPLSTEEKIHQEFGIKPYKKWQQQNSSLFNKMRNLYIKENSEYFSTFQNTIYSMMINIINENQLEVDYKSIQKIESLITKKD